MATHVLYLLQEHSLFLCNDNKKYVVMNTKAKAHDLVCQR